MFGMISWIVLLFIFKVETNMKHQPEIICTDPSLNSGTAIIMMAALTQQGSCIIFTLFDIIIQINNI